MLLSQGYKTCPICGTPSHRNAALCSTCGTSLTDVPILAETPKSSTLKPQYDRRYGETDLQEGELRRRGEVVLFGGLLVLLALGCMGFVALIGVRWLMPAPTPTVFTPAPTVPALVVETNTLPPPPVMATVTPPPPPPSNTPTPGPCSRTVQAGDDLISIAWACGHRSLDVIPLILELNDLSSPDVIQVGQEIFVPWPTETPDPNASAQDSNDSGAESVALADAQAFLTATAFEVVPGLELASAPTKTLAVLPTEMLPSGIIWHTVQPDENIIVIAYAYNTTIESLSQLNPEITFSQCDFGSPTGGDSCVVIIGVGQQVRVPAPTPTLTLSPTFSGSETPTPTLTPTFNAPSALSPADRVMFLRGDFITLRWVASGILSEGETYRVEVEDLTSGEIYRGDTTELFFIIPSEWQGQDRRRHDYRWTVSVIRIDAPDSPRFTTEPRLFTWEGR